MRTITLATNSGEPPLYLNWCARAVRRLATAATGAKSIRRWERLASRLRRVFAQIIISSGNFLFGEIRIGGHCIAA